MHQLTDKYQPRKIQDFVGLDKPRAVLSRLAEQPYGSAWILLGDSGLGKTTIALAFAAAIDSEVHHIASKSCDKETVERIIEKCHYCPWSGEWHVVIVDEADQMSRAAQLAFLSKLDGTATPPKTIFLFTANSTELLEDRFLSRCRKLLFTAPSDSDIAGFLARIWSLEDGAAAPDFHAIAREAKGNIRSALMTLETELLAPGSFEPAKPQIVRSKKVVSMDRSEAARRAWITIRARRVQGVGR